MRTLFTQFARFGIIGGIGFVIDFAVFNLLIATVLSTESLHEGPLLAKVVSTTIAIIFNWLGNRHWTFRAHRGRQLLREGIEFGIVSFAGLLIGLTCLWVSHYLLGFTDRISDNISSNVIGLGLGTLFRFTLYRTWVFAPHRGEAEPSVFPELGTSPIPTGGHAAAPGTSPAAPTPKVDPGASPVAGSR